MSTSIYYLRRYGQNRKLILNSLFVALAYNGMWALAAIAHLLSYSGVDMSETALTLVVCI